MSTQSRFAHPEQMSLKEMAETRRTNAAFRFWGAAVLLESKRELPMRSLRMLLDCAGAYLADGSNEARSSET
jgi:hypothetical protein